MPEHNANMKHTQNISRLLLLRASYHIIRLLKKEVTRNNHFTHRQLVDESPRKRMTNARGNGVPGALEEMHAQ